MIEKPVEGLQTEADEVVCESDQHIRVSGGLLYPAGPSTENIHSGEICELRIAPLDINDFVMKLTSSLVCLDK